MIKIRLYFLLSLFLIALTAKISGTVYAADSGVSLGVTVINIGPPTINDFNYSNLTLSQPVTDSGPAEGAASGSPAAPATETGLIHSTTSGSSVNPTEPVLNNNLSKETNSNSAKQGNNQGIVKGATSDKPTSWFKNFINKFFNFFKRIF